MDTAPKKPSQQPNSLILFIHGLSGSKSTWGKFPSLIKSDAELADKYDIRFYEYPTMLLRLPFAPPMPRIQRLADGLHTQIENRYANNKEINLVCHSLGGLIARKYILDRIKQKQVIRVKKLILFGVPNIGAELARAGDLISWRHGQLRQLSSNSDFLEGLNDDWVNFQIERQVEVKYVIGGQDRIVAADSAKGYWGNRNVDTVIDKGHRGLVKPESKDDDAFIILKNFVHEVTPIRGDLGPVKISLAGLPHAEHHLFGRQKELAIIDEAWQDPNCNIMSLIAWGGVGKSALINHWVRNIEKESYRGAIKVFAFSFHSQGTTDEPVSADIFIESALRWFGDESPTSGKPWDKGVRLAELIRDEPTLLVLDGLEPLQFPPLDPQEPEGKLKDHGLKALLKELALENKGLCLISSRLKITDLDPYVDQSVNRVDLEHLSPEAGGQLLEALGVTGAKDELETAASNFDGHALALNLLGSYLVDVCDGEVRRIGEIGGLEHDVRYGGHARRVMRSYELWFEAGAPLNTLRLLGLFDRPAEEEAVTAICRPPPIRGLTDNMQSLGQVEWRQTLSTLRRAKLIAEVEPAREKILDCHPLVREHFGEQLRLTCPDSWKEGQRRLYEYFKQNSSAQPQTGEQMIPVLASVLHGCKAGRYHEALKLYRERVVQGDRFFSTYKLGAFGNEIALLYHFYVPPWKEPVEQLTKSEKAFVLRQTGFCQRALGILGEAAKWLKQAITIYEEEKNWKECLGTYGLLSYIYLYLGNFQKALDSASRSVELADAANDIYHSWVSRTKVADILHNAGQYEKSEIKFMEAEGILRKEYPDWFLFGVSGFKCCDLLITRNKKDEAKKRAEWIIEWVKNNPDDPSATELTTALANLIIGQVCIKRDDDDVLRKAEKYVSSAYEYIRNSERQDFLVLTLQTRAELSRVRQNYKKAEHDLQSALEISKRGHMALGEADCCIGMARLYLSSGDHERGRREFEHATKMIERMSYHRRDEELKEIARLLNT